MIGGQEHACARIDGFMSSEGVDGDPSSNIRIINSSDLLFYLAPTVPRCDLCDINLLDKTRHGVPRVLEFRGCGNDKRQNGIGKEPFANAQRFSTRRYNYIYVGNSYLIVECSKLRMSLPIWIPRSPRLGRKTNPAVFLIADRG